MIGCPTLCDRFSERPTQLLKTKTCKLDLFVTSQIKLMAVGSECPVEPRAYVMRDSGLCQYVSVLRGLPMFLPILIVNSWRGGEPARVQRTKIGAMNLVTESKNA
jgi:hypothetical protein